MQVIKSNVSYKGTRILLGNEKRAIINQLVNYLIEKGYQEIQIPNIHYREIFKNKVGIENTSMMFSVKDNSERDLVLAPEYTAVVQQLAQTTFKQQKNVKLFYIQECFRGEKPQAGRYRQFTQLGVEILNPMRNYLEELITIASDLIKCLGIDEFEVSRSVTRGLDYYKEGKGFEINYNKIGSSKQICGGGEYEGGIGFAIGVDRILSTV